jgi:hypothetical protein
VEAARNRIVYGEATAMRITPPIIFGDDEDDFWGPEHH